RSRTTLSAKDFAYEDASRRATYRGDARMNGSQGDMTAAKIELFLKESGNELERLEGYEGLTLSDQQRRKTTGARMTYFSADQRYVVTGAPGRIVDECGRESTGATLTFYKGVDRIIVDGNDRARTQTKGASQCP